MKLLTEGKSKLALLGSVAVILIVFPLLVAGKPFTINICILAGISIILGMTFSMLFSAGLISLGCAAFYAIGAYASALLTMKLGLNFWLALPLAIIITGAVALAIGSMLVRNPGFSFVVLTLLFALVVAEVVGQLGFFGGWGGIIDIPRPDPIGPIEFSSNISYYYLLLFLLALVVTVFYALYTSRVGRAWRAIKLSASLAQTLGINAYRYRLLAFVVASSAAGLAGSFYAHYYQTVIPSTFSGWVSIYIQLYAVLGGLEFYILGPAVGAVIMTFAPEFLRVIKEFEPLIMGALLLAIILFFPGGILGTLQKLPRFSLASISARMKRIAKGVFTRDNLTK